MKGTGLGWAALGLPDCTQHLLLPDTQPQALAMLLSQIVHHAASQCRCTACSHSPVPLCWLKLAALACAAAGAAAGGMPWQCPPMVPRPHQPQGVPGAVPDQPGPTPTTRCTPYSSTGPVSQPCACRRSASSSNVGRGRTRWWAGGRGGGSRRCGWTPDSSRRGCSNVRGCCHGGGAASSRPTLIKCWRRCG